LAKGRQEERVQEGGGAGEEKRRFSDGRAEELTRGVRRLDLAKGRQEERVQEGGGAGEEKRRFLDGSADELTRGVRRLDGCGEGGWIWQRGGRKNACRKEEELEKRRDGSRTVAPTT